MQEQSTAAKEISNSIHDLDNTVQQNMEAAGSTLEISEGLSSQADQLREIISGASGSGTNDQSTAQPDAPVKTHPENSNREAA